VFKWLDLSLTRTVQFDVDSFEYCRQITVDLGIPKANDAVPFLLQPHLPFVITLGDLIVIVMAAVEFNDEMPGGTEEVDYVPADRCLPPEMRAVYW